MGISSCRFCDFERGGRNCFWIIRDRVVCEKGLKKIDEKIEYFDDEELDQYKGIPSDSFDDQQIDQFREILYTIRPEELSDWFISLEKRGIELPDVLKQELN